MREAMKPGNQPPEHLDELTADEQEFVTELLDQVPVYDVASATGSGSTWVARRRGDFDMNDQYGDV